MTASEAASKLSISQSMVYKLMNAGELGYQKRGRRKLPDDQSVEEYRVRNNVPAAPKCYPAVGGERRGPGRPPRKRHLVLE